MKRFFFALLMLGSACLAPYAGADTVELDGLKSTTPATWKKQEVSNKFRAYQFTLPRAEGDKEDGEFIVFSFGKGSGGSVEQNLKRWNDMFSTEDGKPVTGKVEEFKVGDVPITYLTVAGTYAFKSAPFDPSAKTIRKDNFRMIAVVFASEDGPHFIRVTGPTRTVEQHKAGFDNWLKGFKK